MSFVRNLMLLTICLTQIGSIALQPADLGTFGSHNDIQHGISMYSSPSEDRIPAEIYVLAYINYTYTNVDGEEISFAEEKAKYGEGRIKKVFGQVVHVTNEHDPSDHTACSDRLKGTNGHALPSPGTSWIALIRRGKCNFEEKVKHVYAHRSVGAIVYNDHDAPTLDKMKILGQERNITAVFTFKSIGEEMARIVDAGHKLNASISEGRYAKPIPNINRTSVLFVSISFIVLMIISFVWLVFYYVQRFRYLQTKDRKSRQLCTVAKRVIAKIPTKSIKSEDNNDTDNDCCAICIEPYKITDVIRVLPCRHEFHKSCIDPWLLEHRTCPMCKMDILKHYGFVFTGSQESILQLDLDTEDGADGNGSNPDEIRIRAHSVSPTYIIQLDTEHAIRRHSIESTGSAAREFNAYQRYRQQIQTQSNRRSVPNDKDPKCAGCMAVAAKHNRKQSIESSPYDKDEDRQQMHASISLPCTLRKCKASETSYNGSNNCYVWAFDFQEVNNKIENSENCASKLKTTSGGSNSRRGSGYTEGTSSVRCFAASKRDGDNEFLLLNEHTGEENCLSATDYNPSEHDDFEFSETLSKTFCIEESQQSESDRYDNDDDDENIGATATAIKDDRECATNNYGCINTTGANRSKQKHGAASKLN